MSQKATIGRIVHVTVTPSTEKGPDHAAAIVTAVDKKGLIDVTVFPHGAQPYFLGGLSLFDSREAVDELRDDEQQAHLVPSSAAYWPAVPAPAKKAAPPKDETPPASQTPPAP